MIIFSRLLFLTTAIFFLFSSVANGTPPAPDELLNHIAGKVSHKKRNPSIVFLITKDTNNYEAHLTIPAFAEMLEKQHGYNVTVLLGSGTHGAYSYPNMEALNDADLLVVFARRIALPEDQLNAIKNYLAKGKPLIGIRTAHHAFSVFDKVEEGHKTWADFTPDILGCINRGYGSAEVGTDVTVVASQKKHPILKGLQAQSWHSEGQIYYVAPLVDQAAVVLIRGKFNDKTEPIAWTRNSGNSKVFYTSLGHPADFKTPMFTTLMLGAIRWALKK